VILPRRHVPPAGVAGSSTPRRGDRGARRRVWAAQLVGLAAAASILGITPGELEHRLAVTPLASIAAERGVDPRRVGQVAASAAAPLLDDAVSRGALTDAERRSITHALTTRIAL
jgi:hypothetical protein